MKIRRLRLYLETTAFNYFFDADRDGHDDTVRLFEAIGAGEFEGYASEYVTNELKGAREPKRGNMLALIDECGINLLEYDAGADVLAELYIKNAIIPPAYHFDSLHIATASVYNMDCVVSYNFQHINRAKTKILTAQVNRKAGYNSVVICTSKEALEYGYEI